MQRNIFHEWWDHYSKTLYKFMNRNDWNRLNAYKYDWKVYIQESLVSSLNDIDVWCING